MQTYVNRAFCALVGFEAGELLDKTAPFAYWPAEDIENIQQAFARTMAGGAPPEGMALRFQRKDGRGAGSAPAGPRAAGATPW